MLSSSPRNELLLHTCHLDIASLSALHTFHLEIKYFRSYLKSSQSDGYLVGIFRYL